VCQGGEANFLLIFPPTPATKTSVCMVVSNQELHEDVEVVDRHREYNNAATAAIEGAAGFTTSSLYLAIFNLLVETSSSFQVRDMPLVEIDDEDMKVLFNLATRCHTLPICESMKIDQTLPFLKATVCSHCPSGLKGSFIRHQE